MANIQPQIDFIRTARLGRDVRESIASGLEAMNLESEDAYNAAITAQNSASNSAQQAAQSATDADNYSQQAAQSATDADNSAQSAAQSATQAQTSATSAATSATQAQTYLNTVRQDAQDAKTAANDAKGSATQAAQSATTATNAAADAQTSRQQAAQSANNAQTSATTANNAQTAASISATNAAVSEQNAYNYAQQAQAAANVDIATTSKPGLVMPDGTTISVDQFGRISVAGLNEHIAQSLISQNGVHGVRIYIDPTTNLIALQRWNATAQNWENLFNGLKPDGDSITMDPDGTLHANIDTHINTLVMSENGVHGLRYLLADEILEAWDGEKWVEISAGSVTSQLTVTTNETDLVGLDVVLTLNGAEVSRLPFTESKTVTFTKLKLAGEYTVTCGEASATVVIALGESKTVELSLFYATVTVNGAITLAPTMDSNYTVPDGYYLSESILNTFTAQLQTAEGVAIETKTFSNKLASFTVDTRTYTSVKVAFMEDSRFTTPPESGVITLVKGATETVNGTYVEKYAQLEVTRTDAELLTQDIVLSWGEGADKQITYTEHGTDKSKFIVKKAGVKYTAVCNGIDGNVDVPTLNNDPENPYSIDLQTTYYLYKDGDECKDITGGWTQDGYTINASIVNNENFILQSNSIYHNLRTGHSGYSVIGSVNKIKDVSKYKTVHVIVNATKVYKGPQISVAFCSQKQRDGSMLAYANVSFSQLNQDIHVQADLSTVVNEDAYIMLITSTEIGNNYGFYGNIKQIWLEP